MQLSPDNAKKLHELLLSEAKRVFIEQREQEQKEQERLQKQEGEQQQIDQLRQEILYSLGN
jgi:ornithine cyclodeaminase/alanine dehydrogenase-like protein (mu-crystallin family)